MLSGLRRVFSRFRDPFAPLLKIRTRKHSHLGSSTWAFVRRGGALLLDRSVPLVQLSEMLTAHSTPRLGSAAFEHVSLVGHIRAQMSMPGVSVFPAARSRRLERRDSRASRGRAHQPTL